MRCTPPVVTWGPRRVRAQGARIAAQKDIELQALKAHSEQQAAHIEHLERQLAQQAAALV